MTSMHAINKIKYKPGHKQTKWDLVVSLTKEKEQSLENQQTTKYCVR
jgi:hypothetical protein